MSIRKTLLGWLNAGANRKATNCFRRTLRFESVENRCLLAACYWTGRVDATWGNVDNWEGSRVPAQGDDAWLDAGRLLNNKVTAIELNQNVLIDNLTATGAAAWSINLNNLSFALDTGGFTSIAPTGNQATSLAFVGSGSANLQLIQVGVGGSGLARLTFQDNVSAAGSFATIGGLAKGTLEVVDNATLSLGSLAVGSDTGIAKSEVFVGQQFLQGSALLVVTNTITVGSGQAGGKFLAGDGAVVSAQTMEVKKLGEAIVQGWQSEVFLDTLRVASGDTAATMIVTSGGTLDSGIIEIGLDGQIGLLEVNGASHVFADTVTVGMYAASGTTTSDLSIIQGSGLTIRQELVIGGGSRGRVTLDSSSTLTSPDITVGDESYGEVQVKGGAAIDLTGLNMRIGRGANGGVVVDGAGSAVRNGNVRVGINSLGGFTVKNGATAPLDGGLYVGDGTHKGTVQILTGGDVTAFEVVVGLGSEGQLLVDGPGSGLHVTGDMLAFQIGLGQNAKGSATAKNGGFIECTRFECGQGTASELILDGGDLSTTANTGISRVHPNSLWREINGGRTQSVHPIVNEGRGEAGQYGNPNPVVAAVLENNGIFEVDGGQFGVAESVIVSGPAQFAAGGQLLIDIFGPAYYDHVDVLNDVSVGGELVANAWYLAGNRQGFAVVSTSTANSLSGTFTGQPSGPLADPSNTEWGVKYDYLDEWRIDSQGKLEFGSDGFRQVFVYVSGWDITATGFDPIVEDTEHPESVGRDVLVSYTIESPATLPGFNIGIYTSLDGTTPDQLLYTHRVTDPSDLTDGPHSVRVSPSFGDPQTDYYLVAVIDSGYEVTERSETNNSVSFAGGVFLDQINQVLHIQGTDPVDDTIDIAGGSSVAVTFNSETFPSYAGLTSIHARLHDGNDTIATSGSALTQSFWVFGGSGNDTITTGDTGDYIEGGNGNDLITALAGNDTVYGGQDDDTLRGQDGADLLYGDGDALSSLSGDDSIEGGAGNDTSFGAGGNDTIKGGADSDLIYGGDDADTILGEDGADVLYGDASTLSTSPGNDSIVGGDGTDWISGGEGSDTIGDSDNPATQFDINYIYGDLELVDLDPAIGVNAGDLITVSSGHARVYGQAGNDSIYAGAAADGAFFGDAHWSNPILSPGNDFISVSSSNQCFIGGGAGNDTLLGGDGDDIMEGGLGQDSMEGRGGNDNMFGGKGDVLDGDGGDTLLGGDGNDSLYGDDGDDLLVGGAGDDDIEGRAGNDTLDGGEGDNELVDPYGNNTFIYGSGADLIYGSAGQTYVGGGGNDTLVGSDGDETFLGGDGNDSFLGGGGNDVFEGGAGNDTARGGAGHDRYVFAGGVNLGSDTIEELSGGGVDTLDFGNLLAGVGLDLRYGSFSCSLVNLYLSDASVIDNIVGSASHANYLIGNALGNSLWGGALDDILGDDPLSDSSDVLYGLGGDDTLNGGFGSDYLYGGDGDDSLIGGGDNEYMLDEDRIEGGAGNDSLFGGFGNDCLSGGDGDDFLDVGSTYPVYYEYASGDGGNDTIYGGGGSDQLIGGDGHDLIYGNDGDDTIYGNEGNDTVDGGQGNDTIDGGSGADLLQGDSGNDTVNGGDGDDTLLGGGGDYDNLSGGAGNDCLVASDGQDNLYGDSGQDTLDGGGGNDFLDGGADNDYVYGSDGDDYLSGGDGHDQLYGGSGNNALYGGYGDDYLGGDSGDDYLSGEAGNDTLSGSSGNDYLYGGADHDYLSGDDGDDNLYGEDGNDTLYGGYGIDYLDGGAGVNELDYGEEGGGGNDFMSTEEPAFALAGGGAEDEAAESDAFWRWATQHWSYSTIDRLRRILVSPLSIQ